MDETKELRPLDREDIEKLLVILKGRIPKSCMLYNVTKLYLDGKYSEKVNVEFYCNEPQQAECLIFAVLSFSYFADKIVIISTVSDDIPNEFVEAIERRIDWNIPHTFGHLIASQVFVITEMCKKNGNPVKEHEYSYYYMGLETDNLMINHISPGVQIKQLSVRHAEKVDEKWADAPQGLAVEMVKDSIESIASIGIFETPSDVIDEGIVSWLIISPFGSFNAFHTEDKFRRRGYGEMALKSMVRYASENLKIFSVCHVDQGNFASKGLMEKVGFKQGENIYWLEYELRPSS